MRYREGDSPDNLSTLDDTMFMGAAALGLLMGTGFVIAGIKAKQYWLAIWGAGLVVASIVYMTFLN